jgi:hypothetical protein
VQVDPIFPLAVRCAFIALFTSALIHKLRAPSAFAEAVRGYAGLLGAPAAVNARLVAALALLVLALEAGLVALLLAPTPPQWRTVACAGVLVGYAALMAWSVVRGRHIDCGCSFGAARQRVGWAAVLRNATLAAGAALMLLPPNGRSLAAADILSVAALLAIVMLVYQVVNQLLANAGTLPRSS